MGRRPIPPKMPSVCAGFAVRTGFPPDVATVATLLSYRCRAPWKNCSDPACCSGAKIDCNHWNGTGLSRSRCFSAFPEPLSSVLSVIPTATPVLIVLSLFLFAPLPIHLALPLPLLVRLPVIPVPTGAILLPLAVRNAPSLLFIPGPVVPGYVQHRPRHLATPDHPPRPGGRARTAPPLTARPPPEPPVEEHVNVGVRDEVDLGPRDHHDFRRLGHHDRRRPRVDVEAHP